MVYIRVELTPEMNSELQRRAEENLRSKKKEALLILKKDLEESSKGRNTTPMDGYNPRRDNPFIIRNNK